MKHKATTSKYNGVAFHKASKKWRAMVMVDGRRVWAGIWPTEVDAARAYNRRLVELGGDLTKLNYGPDGRVL